MALDDRSLLERLGGTPRGGAASGSGGRMESVRRNLGRLLNSRQGLAPAALDYGIPDMVGVVHSLPEGIELLRRSIEESIRRYEPRLARVRVKHTGGANLEDPLRLHFEIQAELVDHGARTPVRFSTAVRSAGSVDVS